MWASQNIPRANVMSSDIFWTAIRIGMPLGVVELGRLFAVLGAIWLYHNGTIFWKRTALVEGIIHDMEVIINFWFISI